MTSKDIKDELVEDLEATDEEAEDVKGGFMAHPDHPDHPLHPLHPLHPDSHGKRP